MKRKIGYVVLLSDGRYAFSDDGSVSVSQTPEIIPDIKEAYAVLLKAINVYTSRGSVQEVYIDDLGVA